MAAKQRPNTKEFREKEVCGPRVGRRSSRNSTPEPAIFNWVQHAGCDETGEGGLNDTEHE